MTIDNLPLTLGGMIRSRHQVRKDFSSCSSGRHFGDIFNVYYMSKTEAIIAFDDALKHYGMFLDFVWDFSDFQGDHDHRTFEIHNKHTTKCVGHAIIMWHMKPSGEYEFIGFIT